MAFALKDWLTHNLMDFSGRKLSEWKRRMEAATFKVLAVMKPQNKACVWGEQVQGYMIVKHKTWTSGNKAVTTQERDSVIALLSTLPPEIFTLLLINSESADNNETQLITPTAESAFPEKTTLFTNKNPLFS